CQQQQMPGLCPGALLVGSRNCCWCFVYIGPFHLLYRENSAATATTAALPPAVILLGLRPDLRQIVRSRRASDCGSHPARETARAWNPGIRSACNRATTAPRGDALGD